VTTLITGGTGLIGTTLAELLLAAGERVVLLDVALPEARVAPLRRHGDRLRLARADVQALGELISAIRAHEVDAIVHLAYVLGAVGNTEPERATRVNVLGTTNALEAARLAGVPRVLLASSIAVYGSDDQYATGELPLGEDAARHVCRTLPIYGGGKLYTEHLAQAYARTYGLIIGGLRPSVVYGPGRDSGASAFLNEVIEKPALGQPVTVGFGEARISFVHVEDVAGQFAALLRCEAAVLARRRFFNTGGDTATVRELARAVERVVPGARITVTDNGERDLGGLVTRVSDRALEDAVGYKRRLSPLETGVRAHANSVRARAGLPSFAG
jgi:nucleoside-diphosphate-sugar epimerase